MATLSKHRQLLDALTADILKKSSAVIQCIDESIRITHSLRLSTCLISQLDLQIGKLSSNLQLYQEYLTQLNSLLIRSEYLETQLNILEKEETQNDMNSDLNWRSTEAIFDNLYLEFRFITKKIDAISGNSSQLHLYNSRRRDSFSSSFKSVYNVTSNLESQRETFRYLSDKAPVVQSIPEKIKQSNLQDKMDDATLIKPIRCGSIKHSKAKRVSTDLKSFNLLALTPVTPISINKKRLSNVSSVSSSESAKKLYQLCTPETTFNSTCKSIFSDGYKTSSKTIDDLENQHIVIDRTRSRCLSLPGSETSLEVNKNANLRHFTSYETGLNIHTPGSKVDSLDDVKESHFVFSPISLHLEEFLTKPKESLKVKETQEMQTLQQGHKLDAPVIKNFTKAITKDEKEEEKSFNIPTFKHKLNRSNLCESTFSTMTTRVPMKLKDNRSQTMEWLKRFTTTKSLNTNISAVSVSNATSINRGTDSKAFTTLASYARPTPPLPVVIKPSASISQTTIPTTQSDQQDTFSKPLILATASFNNFFGKLSPLSNNSTTNPESPKKLALSKSKPSKPTLKTTKTAFSNTTASTSDHKPQWASSLFAKFNPNNMIQNPVISEVGKVIPKPRKAPSNAILTTPRQLKSSPFIKGSFSTLKITNGNKMIQHGQSSDLGKSIVVSTRVSYDALCDALEELQ